MESTTPDAIADRVVAWHNRHPLARRITRRQVDGIGVVALPCLAAPGDAPAAAATPPPTEVPPEAAEPQAGAEGIDAQPDATAPAAEAPPEDPAAAAAEPPAEEPAPDAAEPPAEEPAPAAAESQADAVDAEPPAAPPAAEQIPTLDQAADTQTHDAPDAEPASPDGPPRTPLFSEAFIAGLSARRVGRWASQQGTTQRPDAPGLPYRRIAVDTALRPAPAAAAVTLLHVWVAAIDNGGGRRRRVLVGAQPGGSVLGRRLLSPLRLAIAAALPAAIAAAAWTYLPSGAPADAAAPPAASAPPASLPVAASAPPPVASLPPASAASTPTVTASAAMPAPASATAQARAPAIIEEIEEKAPPPQRPALPDTAPSGNLLEPYRIAPLQPTLDAALKQRLLQEGRGLRTGVAPSAPAAVYYALVARPARSESEAAATLERMREAAANLPGPARGEVMRTGAMWRATWWPYVDRGAADRAREAFAASGLQLELIAF